MSECYVEILPCGCAVAAMVDWTDAPEGYRKDLSKFVSRAIGRGNRVDRKPTEWVRENLLRCKHKERQMEIPE